MQIALSHLAKRHSPINEYANTDTVNDYQKQLEK